MKLLLPFCIFFLSLSLKAQDQVIPTFLEKWENSKTYLLKIAQAMPLEQYDYKPTPRAMSFKEQLQHIQQNMDWLRSSYLQQSEQKVKKSSPENEKEQLIAELSNAFDALSIALGEIPTSELATKVDFFAGEKTKLQILNLLQDHVTHHRGQLIVYLNLNQITPPKYIGW
ncbi:DinB family protein [Arenibacter sp. 6A1]|uniref:DinB family protein n=1 Tax=Arenibacter sp. 6A1 TaxID=2720391 RepID=UPI001445E664|nr:DinB family protein [Arenibacter sp. 6A1]NKI26753.1 DinB family protein [Arenibacter sp. 6A1]